MQGSSSGHGGALLRSRRGTQTRDYIFIGDLIRAIKLSATTEGVGGETFQIATNAETTVREIADRLIPALAEAGIKDVEVRHTDARRGEVRRNFADTSKAKRLLGWQPEMDPTRAAPQRAVFMEGR